MTADVLVVIRVGVWLGGRPAVRLILANFPFVAKPCHENGPERDEDCERDYGPWRLPLRLHHIRYTFTLEADTRGFN